MRQHFQLHEAEFERIVSMSNEDFSRTKVTRISNDFTRLVDDWNWPRAPDRIGLSFERWTDYRELFQRLKLPAGIDRENVDGGHIRFMVFGRGMAGEGTEYGYLWTRQPPQIRESHEQSFVVKPLKDHWYLYDWQID